jgi:MFS family permease
MTEAARTGVPEGTAGSQRLAILLAMAMFVLVVVDTSLMNVSISAVVGDLDTTVSGVQSAIALEALVSAAFILIGGKVGDLIGRKRIRAGSARLHHRRTGHGACPGLTACWGSSTRSG